MYFSFEQFFKLNDFEDYVVIKPLLYIILFQVPLHIILYLGLQEA